MWEQIVEKQKIKIVVFRCPVCSSLRVRATLWICACVCVYSTSILIKSRCYVTSVFSVYHFVSCRKREKSPKTKTEKISRFPKKKQSKQRNSFYYLIFGFPFIILKKCSVFILARKKIGSALPFSVETRKKRKKKKSWKVQADQDNRWNIVLRVLQSKLHK